MKVYRAVFWTNPWIVSEFTLIVVSVLCGHLDTIYPGLSAIRLVREFRLVEMLHIMVNSKPLYMIVKDFARLFKVSSELVSYC